MEYNLVDIKNQIKDIVYNIKDIMMNANRERLDIETKEGNNNIVTKYDKLIQENLKNELLKLIPESKFCGEENDEADKSQFNDGFIFIVDPIDGTTNFARDLSISSISVALFYKGDIVIGVCYNPYLDEMFEAVKGCGAYLNNNKISVSKKELKNGLLYCGLSPYYNELREKSIEIHKKLFMIASDYRRFGSAVIEICNVAAGRGELYYELKLMPWDYAAASLILKEAGGCVTTITGDELQYENPSSILASNGYEDYLKYLN